VNAVGHSSVNTEISTVIGSDRLGSADWFQEVETSLTDYETCNGLHDAAIVDSVMLHTGCLVAFKIVAKATRAVDRGSKWLEGLDRCDGLPAVV
jgi:hypothetical protein